jgi:hypothetical protein
MEQPDHGDPAVCFEGFRGEVFSTLLERVIMVHLGRV